MKKILILLLFIPLVFGCSDDENECSYESLLETLEASNIDETSVTLNGAINTSSNCENTNNIEQGFVYSTSIQPTVDDIKINANGNNLTVNIDGLEANTTYYARVFIINNIGEFYGNEISFTTVAGQVVINTLNFNNITENSVISGGQILSDGNTTINSKGVCWSTNPNPTIDNNFVENFENSYNFQSTIEDLSPNTQYFVRAFATNEFGVFYGNELDFETNCITPTIEINQNLYNNDGNISIEFEYLISNQEGFSIDNIILSYSYNNEIFSQNVGNSIQNTLVYDELIPLTNYYDISLTIESEDCGNISINYENFETPSRYEIGDFAQGGIIVYMYPNGYNGIAAAEIDFGKGSWACDIQNDNIFWSSYNTNGESIDDWQGNIGDGDISSNSILDFLNNGTGNSVNGYFANFCNCIQNPKAVELATNSIHNGFDDWYLPHIKTLHQIYQVYELGLITNFEDAEGCMTGQEKFYASSCGDGANAGFFNFDNGSVGKGSFGAKFNVRAVRKF